MLVRIEFKSPYEMASIYLYVSVIYDVDCNYEVCGIKLTNETTGQEIDVTDWFDAKKFDLEITSAIEQELYEIGIVI